MDYNKLTFYSDAGHGWLRVPIDEIRLAVLQGLQISRFSYISKKYVYLEEDCDLNAWVNFRQIPVEVRQNWKTINGSGQSSIRNKLNFSTNLLF